MIRWSILALALAACSSPAASPRAPTGAVPRPTVGPWATTARDGVVVRTLLDRADGVCAWQHYSHVEAFAIDTGATVWSLPTWTQLVAELPSGELIVTNEGFGVAGHLRAAVVRRADGTLLATCDAPIDASGLGISWAIAPEGLVAAAYRLRGPSGIMDEPPPPEPSLFFTTTGDSCTFGVIDHDTGAPSVLLAGTRDLAIDDVTIHDVTTGTGISPPRALVAERAGQTLWRRDLVPDPNIPCNLP